MNETLFRDLAHACTATDCHAAPQTSYTQATGCSSCARRRKYTKDTGSNWMNVQWRVIGRSPNHVVRSAIVLFALQRLSATLAMNSVSGFFAFRHRQFFLRRRPEDRNP